MNKRRILSLVLTLVLVVSASSLAALSMAEDTITGSADDYNGADMWLRYVPIEDPALLQSYKNTVKSVIVPENNAADLFRFSDTDVFEESYGYKGLRQPEGSVQVIPKTTLGAVRIELDLALKGMLGAAVPAETTLTDGALIVGTPGTSNIIAGLSLGDALAKVGDEGYIIRSVTIEGKAATVIAGNTEIGALYGTYAFLRLMQTQESIVNLDISDFPKINHRRINSWDKERLYAGSDESGYGKNGRNGESGFIFNWDLSIPSSGITGNHAHSNAANGAVIMPVILDRYIVAARALASVGINEFNLNNVNSNSAYTSEYVIRQEAALADLLRPYGIKICLSTNYGAPTLALPNQDGTQVTVANGGNGGKKVWADDTERIGSAIAAVIHSDAYSRWWYTKTLQIMKRIPDFAGYTVKANSEGQAGPQDYGDTHAFGANNMAKYLNTGELAGKGITVFWRSFVYNAEVDNDRLNRAYMEFAEADDNEEFPDHVFVQTKNGPLDFQAREIFHPMFGRMPNTNQAVEFQITMEYLGHTTYMTFLGPLYEEVLKANTYANGPDSYTPVGSILDGSAQGHSDSAMVGVNNMGNNENVTGHNFLQANTYTFGRQAWDWTLNSEDIADEWTRMTWSNDDEIVETIVDMMMGSREAVVASQNTLGLMHQQGQNGGSSAEHYSPGFWDFSASQDDWTPSYYNKVMKDGIGFRRTVEGRIADLLPVPEPGSYEEKLYPLTNQFYSPLTELFSDIETCPEDYLLTFHHVPWDHIMKNGKTLWEELIYRPQMAVQYATNLRETWAALEGKIDNRRWAHTMQKMIGQEFDMAVWRDKAAEYWCIVNGRDLPTDTAPLSIKVKVAGGVHGGFDLNYGTTSKTSGNGIDAVPTSAITGFNFPKSGVGTRPYTIYVPYGTTVPTIDDVIPYASDAEYTIVKQPADMNDTAVVKVTKTDYFGKLVQNYTFKFQYDTTLAGVAIDGVALESFKANKDRYDVYTASSAPVLTATANDPAATVTIEQSNAVPSTATISVANNGAPVSTYTVMLGAPGSGTEDFDGRTLDGKWSVVRENAETWDLTSVPGALTITSEEGDLRGNNNTAKNIILRDAPDGDWVIESKVNFSRRPEVNNEQGGIIVYLNDQNYLMLAWKMRATNGSLQQGTHAVEFLREQGGTQTSYQNFYKDVSERAAGVDQDQIWLRIEKKGNQYLGYFSNNGKDWKPSRLATSTQVSANPITFTPNVSAPVKVGVVAMHQNANVSAYDPMDVSYDYFKVSSVGEVIPFTSVEINREQDSADFTVANRSAESLDALCILATYDDGGRLKEVIEERISAEADSVERASIAVPAGTHSVRAFIWEDKSYIPLCDSAARGF
jgi:alpha-glucuronidase